MVVAWCYLLPMNNTYSITNGHSTLSFTVSSRFPGTVGVEKRGAHAATLTDPDCWFIRMPVAKARATYRKYLGKGYKAGTREELLAA